MSKINSFAPGAGGCYRPEVPTHLPTGPIKIQPFPEPQLPTRPGDFFDRVLTRSRSQQLGETQASQLESIRSGVENGSITQDEAARLLDQQARISDAVKRAGADGVITAQEQTQIRNLQRQASLSNFVAAHNGQNSSQAPNQVQLQQLSIIADGVRSGQLNGRETASLLREQSGIARDISAAQADGKTSLKELLEQFSEQRTAGNNIRRDKNDLETAAHARPSRFPIHLF